MIVHIYIASLQQQSNDDSTGGFTVFCRFMNMFHLRMSMIYTHVCIQHPTQLMTSIHHGIVGGWGT